MKNLLFLFLICLGSCSSRSKLIKKQPIADNFVQQPQKVNKESANQHKLLKDSSKMVFIIKTKNFKTKNSNIILDLEFKNLSDDRIKLLDMFELDAFFSIGFYPEGGGNSIEPVSGGLIDFPRSTVLKYIEIPKGKSYFKTVDLTPLLKSRGMVLDSKTYTLQMSYLNYHGKDCIKGRFHGSTVKLQIIN